MTSSLSSLHNHSPYLYNVRVGKVSRVAFRFDPDFPPISPTKKDDDKRALERIRRLESHCDTHHLAPRPPFWLGETRF